MMNIACGIVIGVCILVLFTTPKNIKHKTFWSSYDDTDDFDNKKKSGLILYIDYGTGCHYIKTGAFDSLVPRLDAKGKIICNKQEQNK